ncbi:type II toxin-antitoxin system PemK/MazF family toxin [Ornithinimicrobium sp. Y1847]|uniref:type II toxin-antitoxin system PemK/MazF family toxin n=1 Tax=Ornithinimicrobium sp. Y1847 TaxID=3405419 RepID=UPI003B676719
MIAWAEFDPAVGREQGSRRPILVVASRGYLEVVDQLVLVLPITSIDRGWPNHVPLGGLPHPSFAMTEQVRTVSRSWIHGRLRVATSDELATVRRWLGDSLDLPSA